MINVKEIIKNIDYKIYYLESSNFYKDMSKIEDMNYFIQVMQTKEGEEKNKIEDGIIYLLEQETIKDYEKMFLDKYHQYLNEILNIDEKEYLNNNYCKYLLSKSLAENNRNEEFFINGKIIQKIIDIIGSKYDELSENLYNDKELGDNDKTFIENYYLLTAFYGTIYKEFDGEEYLMYDIVDFFKKYPIKDLSNPRNKQLDILRVLSNEMIKFNSNCAIEFNDKKSFDSKGTETLGSYLYIPEENLSKIIINGLDVYDIKTEKEYLNKMFTVFHEIGHLFQNDNTDLYNEEYKKIISMENELLKYNRTFYDNNHDSFFIERDADTYAILEFANLYKDQYLKTVYDIVTRKNSRKRIDWPTFYLMELEEYANLSEEQKTNKMHK